MDLDLQPAQETGRFNNNVQNPEIKKQNMENLKNSLRTSAAAPGGIQMSY